MKKIEMEIYGRHYVIVVKGDKYTIYDEDGDVVRTFYSSEPWTEGQLEELIEAIENAYERGVKVGKALRSREILRLLQDEV